MWNTDLATMSANVIHIQLDRSSGECLGIDVARPSCQGWDEKTLLIEKLQPSGLVARWNEEHLTLAVLPGDRIVEVNGCKGVSQLLLAKCQGLNVLHVSVERVDDPRLREVKDPRDLEVLAWQRFQEYGSNTSVQGCAYPVRSVAPAKVLALEKAVARETSATGVVQLLRREISSWDFAWGAVALHAVARQSTVHTRKSWAKDSTVMEAAARMKESLESQTVNVGAFLTALEALRRLELQGPTDQRQCAERMRKAVASNLSGSTTTTLARVLWVCAPLRVPGLSPIRNELRKRHKELGAFDVVLVIESWGSDAVAMGSLVEGTELTERLHGTPHFKLSFEVTPSGVVRDASTLLSVAWRTDPDGAERHAEESLFELSFHLTAKTTRLVTVLGASEKAGSRCAWPAPVLPVGDVARVMVHVSPGRCVLYVNGHEVSSTPLPKVELVGSTARVRGSGRHAEVANASITNLVYSPLKVTAVEDPLTQRLLVRLREERLHDGMQASDLLMVLARLDSLDLHDEGAFCFFLVFFGSFPVVFLIRLVFVPCFLARLCIFI